VSTKKAIWICVLVGSIVGGYIPVLLFHSSVFSLVSILGNGVGGFIGIWVGMKIGND